MIERKFVKEKIKEFQIKEFIDSKMSGVGHSKSKLLRTPLGDKIVIHTSRPGLVVGRAGANITKITKDLKERFSLENPQVEISEIKNPSLDPVIIAEKISSALERFGVARFKGLGHKSLAEVMGAGAKGVEITISGRIPGMRAKTWRFYQGFLKKCGDIAISDILYAQKIAKLKSGVVGIKVTIMPPNVRLPDDVRFLEADVEEVSEEKLETETVEEVTKKQNKEKTKKPKKETKVKEKTVKKKESEAENGRN
jgi:small subunit ribosomal protein S3